MSRILIAMAALLAWTVLVFFIAWSWRGSRCEVVLSTSETSVVKQSLTAEKDARATEQAQASAAQSAGDKADTRKETINADYQKRLDAALAGRDSELGRLRQQWAGCETNRLSLDSATAAAAAEEDRLRRASAAGILRAVELAQSERDEAVDRYQAVYAGTP